MLRYRGYKGRVESDDEAELFHGEVINPPDVATFRSTSVEELEGASQDSIDDYVEFCEEPVRTFSGLRTG